MEQRFKADDDLAHTSIPDFRLVSTASLPTLTALQIVATQTMQSMQKLNRLGVGSKGPMPMMPRVTTPRHLPKLAPNVREHINRRVESAGTNMKQLINKPEDTVREMIEGMVMCYPHLGFLDGIPDIKVLFDKKHDKNKVAIIGGGGSGHEPATGGYVGEGMLAAAVCGEVFASPSAEAVLAAIRTVTGPGGCLIIVLNYTGDRLHFGLAVEQAKAEGLDVEMMFVGEDVAIETPGIAGRRGLAGTALVMKVAGAASASGKTLKEVTSLANKAADSMATMGAALYVCTLPGKETSDRLSSSEIEIGLGIHSEPGFVKADHMGVGELTQRLVAQMAASHHLQGGLNKDEPVALLVNNLGGSTQMEMMVAAREALNVLSAEYNVKVERVFVGQYVTSLDMRGLSLTVMKLGEGADRQTFTELLDMSTVAPGWPNSGHQATSHSSALVATPLPGRKLGEKPPKPEVVRPDSPSEAGLMLERCMKAASESVLAVAAELDELDGKVGDGDCGSTLSLGANAILADLAAGYYPIDDAPSTMVGVGGAIRRSMGGSSGGLYDIFFTAAARALKEAEVCDDKAWAAALRAGVEAGSKYGGAIKGSRTMLDALFPAAEAAAAAADQGLSGAEVMAATAKAATEGSDSTKAMDASAGRSSYVPVEVLKTVVDPGAKGVAEWMEAINAARG